MRGSSHGGFQHGSVGGPVNINELWPIAVGLASAAFSAGMAWMSIRMVAKSVEDARALLDTKIDFLGQKIDSLSRQSERIEHIDRKLAVVESQVEAMLDRSRK